MIIESTLSSQAMPIPVYDSDTDRLRIDRHLERVLFRFRSHFQSRPEFRACADQISEFVLNGGKRVRPKLCLATYRILKEELPDSSVPRSLLWIAASLELFHAFMLVHDDLIDKSPVRRSRDSLHESIRKNAPNFHSAPMSEHKSASLALVIGDIMFSLGMSMVTQAGLEGRTARSVQKIVTDMLLETGLGQGLDILFEDRDLESFEGTEFDNDILTMYLLKTARYTITGPLMIGAAMANSNPDVMKGLGKIGDLLGLAYQINNDLEDLQKAELGQDCSDLETGKRTPILIHTFQNLSPAGRRSLSGLLESGSGPEKCKKILALMKSTGALNWAHQMVSRLRFEAISHIQELPVSSAKRQAISNLISLYQL